MSTDWSLQGLNLNCFLKSVGYKILTCEHGSKWSHQEGQCFHPSHSCLVNSFYDRIKRGKKWILSLPTAQENPLFNFLWLGEAGAVRTCLTNQVEDHADQKMATLWTLKLIPSMFLMSMAVPQCLPIAGDKSHWSSDFSSSINNIASLVLCLK